MSKARKLPFVALLEMTRTKMVDFFLKCNDEGNGMTALVIPRVVSIQQELKENF